MDTTIQIAKHLRDVHFGGNWTTVNLRDSLADVTWQQATKQVYSLNTIATLLFHINYYVSEVLKVLEGGPLLASDKYSFDCPPIRSQEDWDRMRNKAWDDAERFATLLEQLPDSRLGDFFEQEKYGSYYRNMHGLIEHTHYHLGQIVLLKRIIAPSA